MNKSAISVNTRAQEGDMNQSAMIESWNSDLSPIWKRLTEYHKLLLEEAQKSPCVRRKIATGFFSYNLKNGYSLEHNKRISSCCDHECEGLACKDH